MTDEELRAALTTIITAAEAADFGVGDTDGLHAVVTVGLLRVLLDRLG